jgi:hypothetical protein
VTEIQSTVSSSRRRSFFVRVILAIQATVDATIAFILGATTLAPSFSRRDAAWRQAGELDWLENQPVPVTLRFTHVDLLDEDVSGGVRREVDGASPGRGRRPRSRRVANGRGPRLDRVLGERCSPSLSDYVVARQHIRIPARIGFHFLAARKEDQCVAFQLYL